MGGHWKDDEPYAAWIARHKKAQDEAEARFEAASDEAKESETYFGLDAAAGHIAVEEFEDLLARRDLDSRPRGSEPLDRDERGFGLAGRMQDRFRQFRNNVGQGSFGWESLAPLPPKTSKSHPLRVDWFRPEVLGVAGALGMTFAPGKTNPRGVHGEHRRSMTEDLNRLAQRERADALVTLMEAPELHANKMDDLGPECRARGIEHLVLSIRDQSIPTDLHATIALVEDIADRLSAGKRVVVHCRGGHGRTGMIVACVLVALGYNADDAVTVTRATRSGTVHTDAQYDFVRRYQRWLEVDDTEEEAEFNV